MAKVLLVLDKLEDLAPMEQLFRMGGFNVAAINSEFPVAEQVNVFKPDLLIALGKSKKVNCINVARRLNTLSYWRGKSLLVFPRGETPRPEDRKQMRWEASLELPVTPKALLLKGAELLGLQAEEILNKISSAIEKAKKQKQGFEPNSPSNQGAAGDGKLKIGGGAPTEAKSSVKIKPSTEGGAAEDLELAIARALGADPFGEPSGGPPASEPQAISGPRRRNETDSNETTPWSDLSGFLNQSLEPENEAPSASQPMAPPPPDVSNSLFRKDLWEAQNGLSEKLGRYNQIVKSIKLTQANNISRVEARKRQREFNKEWDEAAIRNLDDLRREFTTQLFSLPPRSSQKKSAS